MVTLTLIYFSFVTGRWDVTHHRVDADRCACIYQSVRRKVKAGRIWGVCHS